MPYAENCYRSNDGLTLHERNWLPETEPSAAVLLVHGFTEHSGRYAELAERLAARGYAVSAPELRGHGKSEGEAILVRSFDDYVADLETALDRVRNHHPGKPLFLLGHSLGGALVVLLAIRRAADLSGAVVSAGAIQIGGQVFPLLRRLAWLLSRLAPRLRLVRVGTRWLSRDPQVVADFRDDPLVAHCRIPIRTATEILRAARMVGEHMETVNVPLLIVHGTGDMITDPGGSRLLHARAASTDKTLKLYEGLYHDLFHEPEKEQLISDVIEWLDARR